MDPLAYDSSYKEDLEDIILAHKHRLTLKTAPKQSNFRVVALVFYKLKHQDPFEILPNESKYDVHNFCNRNFYKKSIGTENIQDERLYVVGANEEPCHMGGSICAERSALAQLRFVPNLDRVTKVVIATDTENEVMPGMLCREFMASLIPWDTPIVLSGGTCRHCGLDVTAANVWGQENGEVTAQSECNGVCFANFHNKRHPQVSGMHDFLRRKVTVRDLYPYPSPYVKLSSNESVMLGKMFSKNFETTGMDESKTIDQNSDFMPLDEDQICVEVNSGENRLSAHKNCECKKDYEIRRQSISTCSTEPMSDESSLTSDNYRYSESKYAEDEPNQFSSPVRNDRKKPRTTDDCSNLVQLLSKHIVRCAQEAALNDAKCLHPIKYGAAVFFSDGSIAQTHQKQSQEYGCTLDAVTQLASFIEHKIEGGRIRPILLVQCDQFGIAHAPFAEARAYLSEYGHNDMFVAIHNIIGEELTHIKNEFGNGKGKLEQTLDHELKIVKVKDLTPNALGLGGGILNNTHPDSAISSRL